MFWVFFLRCLLGKGVEKWGLLIFCSYFEDFRPCFFCKTSFQKSGFGVLLCPKKT